MKYAISAILFLFCQQSLTASVSFLQPYLVEGDMEGALSEKRQFIKTIVDRVKEIKTMPLKSRDDESWYSDVEWSLNKASKLSPGRLGRLEVLQAPYLEWVHTTFEYYFQEEPISDVKVESSSAVKVEPISDVKVEPSSAVKMEPVSDVKDVIPDSRRKVLSERLIELEGNLSKALREQMEAKLADIHFVSPITLNSQIENQMAFVMDYIEKDVPLALQAFQAPDFVIECTPCTQKNMTLKPLLQMMGEDLLKLRKIQAEFMPVYAKLGEASFNVHQLSPTIRAHISTLTTIQEHYLEAKNYKAEEFPAIKAKLVEGAKNKVLAESALATTLRYVDIPEAETTVRLAETLVRNYCLAQWSEHLLGGVSMLSETLVDQGALCPAGAGGRFFKDSLHFTVLLLEDFLS